VDGADSAQLSTAASNANSAAAVPTPDSVETAKPTVATNRTAHPNATTETDAPQPTDLLAELIGIHAADEERLTEVELVTLVWHLVLTGQTPALLIANAVQALLAHPDQLAALRADPALMPGAVEELTRWCGPQLLTLPRFAREDADIAGVPIGKGEPVTAALAGANRDPRAFPDPDRLDLRRPAGRPAHLGYAHGPHFCLGAALARVQTEVALSALLRRFPELSIADGGTERIPDPGAWRLTTLSVTL
jgi:cytochrome P450